MGLFYNDVSIQKMKGMFIMYGVSELAKMYNTTRQTIYNKFKDERLKEYFAYEDGKKRLKLEWLQIFNHIMAESKNIDVNDDDNINAKITDEIDAKPSGLTSEYIESLKQQIDDLKKDKSKLQEQLSHVLKDNSMLHEKLSQIANTLLEQQRLLEEPKERKGLWRIFGK